MTTTIEQISEGIQDLQTILNEYTELQDCGVVLEKAQEYLSQGYTPRQESLTLQDQVEQTFREALREQKSHATYVAKSVEAILDSVVYYNAHLENPYLWDEDHALYSLQCALDYLARSQQATA